MDPVLKSILTSFLKDIITGVGGVLVAHGYISTGQQGQFVEMGVGVALVAVSQLLSWYKARQASPAGLVQSIGNTDPKKVAAAVDAAPLPAQTAMVAVVSQSKVLPSNGGGK